MALHQLVSSHAGYMRRFRRLEACLLLSVATLIAQLAPDVQHAWRYWAWRGYFARADLVDAKMNRWQVAYFVSLPKDYSREKQWPMLLYLHGAGQRGDDVTHLLTWGLPELIAKGKQIPMIVVAPQCRANTNWDSRQLQVFLDYLERQFPIDSDRIYLGGESMGGYGTWAFSAAAPERFAAAVPVCGGGDVGQADRLVKLPIWAFHGAEDKLVPVNQSREMVDAVLARGGDVRLTVFSGEGHGISELVFSSDELSAWLLEHRRRGSEIPKSRSN